MYIVNKQKNMYLINKNIGETPLQCLERNFDLSKNKYTYAGRLDPMAEGLLLVLEGEECKSAKDYWHLPKKYIYSFIVGIETDSYDFLGLVKECKIEKNSINFESVIQKIKSNVELKYPIYSSKTIDGKPLFQYQKENIEVQRVEYVGEIIEHKFLGCEFVKLKDLIDEKIIAIENIDGDFRQKEIINCWEKIKEIGGDVQVCSAEVLVKGGVYVRSIAEKISDEVGVQVMCSGIKRIQIGNLDSTSANSSLPLDKFL